MFSLQRIAGLFFLLVPFVPVQKIFGPVKGLDEALTGYFFGLSTFITFSLAWVISFLIPESFFSALSCRVVSLVKKYAHVLQCVAVIALPCILVLASLYVFEGRPHLVDSAVQLFQAEIFAAGKIKASVPAYPEFFMTQHMLFDDEGWYGQYPPLHSVFLMIGVLFSAPWLVNIVLTCVSALCLFLFVKEQFGRVQAWILFLSLLISPFFIFMGASFMNHVSALACIASFLLFFHRWERNRLLSNLFFACLSGGSIFLIRPLTGIALLLPFVPSALKMLMSGKRLSEYSVVLFSMLGLLGALIFYNLSTTGSPFLIGYIKLWGESHGLGFHESPWGNPHSPWLGLRNELADQQYLQEMIFEWSIPSLLPLSLYLLLAPSLTQIERRMLVGSLLLPFAYFFYWHRDAFLGPRFMYESLAYLLPLFSISLVSLYQKTKGLSFKLAGVMKPVSLRVFFGLTLCISMFYSFGLTIPDRVDRYLNFLGSFKTSVTQEAQRAGINSGIIFVKVSFGNRLFASLRGYGVEPSLVQKSYSRLDHCLLFETLQEAKRESWDVDRVREKLRYYLNTEPRAYTARINDDPTLKLKKGGRLTIGCQDELRYDENGRFTIYTGAFRENSPHLKAPFVIVRDLRERNSLVLNQWPDLQPYMFDGTTVMPYEFRE